MFYSFLTPQGPEENQILRMVMMLFGHLFCIFHLLKFILDSTEDIWTDGLLICPKKFASLEMFQLRTTVLLNLLPLSPASAISCEVNIMEFQRDLSPSFCRGDTAEKPHTCHFSAGELCSSSQPNLAAFSVLLSSSVRQRVYRGGQ